MTFGKKNALLVALGALHGAVLLAGFFAPYDSTQQNRELPFAPPSRIHFVDARGQIHLRPFACALEDRPGAFGEYLENREKCLPVDFLVNGAPYELFGVWKTNLHLFGVSSPGKIFLMGTD